MILRRMRTRLRDRWAPLGRAGERGSAVLAGSGSPRGRVGERGSATLELVILTPVVILIFGLLIAAGRVAIAGGTISQVAGDAARAASLSRNVEQANARANALVTEVVAANRLACQPAVIIDATELTKPAGTPGQVTVDVSCEVNLSDVGVPGMPGSVTLRGSGTAAIDTYRASTP